MQAVKATIFYDNKMNCVIHFILAYIVSSPFMFIYLFLLTHFLSFLFLSNLLSSTLFVSWCLKMNFQVSQATNLSLLYN